MRNNLSNLVITFYIKNNDIKKFCNYYSLNIVLKKNYSKHRLYILNELKKKFIGFSIYYPGPVPLFNYYKRKYKIKKTFYPNSLYLSNSTISFPIAPHIDKNQIKYITDNLQKILRKIK